MLFDDKNGEAIGYKTLLDPRLKELRKKLEKMWAKFEPYADNDFITRFQNFDCISAFWEMFLANMLMQENIKLREKRKTKSPDLLVDIDGKNVWIEAVTPNLGNTPNGVSPMQDNDYGLSPHRNIKLRITSSIEKKCIQYKKYLADGIIKKEDLYIVAINLVNISNAGFPSTPYELSYSRQVLFGKGDIKIGISSNSGEITDMFYSDCPDIVKSNKAIVETNFFCDKKYNFLNAVIESQSVQPWALEYDLEQKLSSFISDFIVNPNSEFPVASQLAFLNPKNSDAYQNKR